MARYPGGLIVLLLLSWSALGITLAQDGQPTVGIFVANAASLPEQTAAQELADYLGKAASAAFVAKPESEASKDGSAIFVGPTAHAKGLGVNPDTLGPEEWVIRTSGNQVLLVGGRPRGTLYAVYHFLEDVIGVHWWNAYEESVPHISTLTIGTVDLHGQPAFRYRDIYQLDGNDGGRFAARNRLNRDGDAPIAPAYGGEMAYGPPYHVHTFYMYIPPDTCFSAHPEWFALVGGERKREQAQLCLTNPEVAPTRP